jgi:alpha-mannosidase
MFILRYLFKALFLIPLFIFCAYPQEHVDKVLNTLSKFTPSKLKGWKTESGAEIEAAGLNFDDSKWTNVGDSYSTEDNNRWFRVKIKIPDKISDQNSKEEKILLSLEVDGKCTVYVNGNMIGQFDKPKERKKVILIDKAKPGEEFTIAINIERIGVISRFFGGTLELEKMSGVLKEIDDFILSLQISRMMTTETKEFLRGKTFTINQSKTPIEQIKNLRKILNDACSIVDIAALEKNGYDKFLKSIEEARKMMEPISGFSKEYTIYITGNAHIDAAWLWRWAETVDVARYTFLQQLNLMDEYPEYVFSQSSAVYYKWMQDNFPDIFERIKEKVKTGNWELVGGTIIEPDCNLISGESWARQILYGFSLFKEYFDMMILLGWNPDSFGYNWNMPQLYKLAGIKAFITQKISWNDTNEFPYHLFWWEAPDGSRILTYFPMSGYVNSLPYGDMIRDLKQSEANTGRKDVLVLYGFGDHGGGPERYMLERVLKYKDNPFFPKVVFAKAYDYLKNMSEEYLKTIPVWKDELYLEFHRGTYTTQAANKAGNRKSEHLLADAEKISSLAFIMGDKYPQDEFRNAWWKVLFNQFHDILPGSSIAPVYRDSKEDYDKVKETGNDIINNSIEFISKNIKADKKMTGKPFIVFNPLSWERNEIGYIDLPKELKGKYFKILDDQKQEVPYQIFPEDKKIAFLASKIPSLGYRVFYLQESNNPSSFKPLVNVNNETIENEFFKVTVDTKTGNISGIFDKINKKEILKTPGNLLQLFEDKPTEYDAWEIKYTGKKWELNSATRVGVIVKGPIVAKIRVNKDFLGETKSKNVPTTNFPSSFFVQDITLYANVPRIDINMTADWWEDHILMKAAFPVNVNNTKATYEIPNAAIQRSTTRKNSWERARYEVPALQWADLSDKEYGVSLLNESKYGYDIEGNMMRLTLLRSPTSPDPKADRGKHKFTYSIYPHKGSWQEAGTVQKGYELNNPLITQFIELSNTKSGMGSNYSMMNIIPTSVVVSAVKKSEGGNALIIRLYESTGKDCLAKLNLSISPRSVRETNLLEQELGNLKFEGKIIEISLRAFETKTIKVEY